MIKKILLIMINLSVVLIAQDNWTPFNYLIGEWTGHETGKAGIGTGSRTYGFVMAEKYIFIKNTSTFDPQEANPAGEIHEDQGFISYDKYRKIFVLREFHIEGYVNQYTLDTLASNNTNLVFVSESIENIPPGWQARLTLEKTDKNHFTELFELAAPNKEFETYILNYWTRK